MKNLLTIIALLLFLSSCSVVKRNGYYQTPNYRLKHFSLKEYQGKHRRSGSERPAPFSVEQAPTLSAKALTFSIPSPEIQVPDLPVRIEGPNLSAPEYTLGTELPGQVRQRIRSGSDSDGGDSIEGMSDEKQMHWASIVGLSSGILAFFIAGLILSIVAIVFSGIALSAINKNPEKYSGRGMAIAGLICGVVALVLTLVLLAALV